MVRKIIQWVPIDGTRWRNEVANGHEILGVVSITALLMVVTWRPFAGYQVPLDLVVCAGAVMGVLALFFIKHEMKTHYDVDDRSNPSRQVTVRLRA